MKSLAVFYHCRLSGGEVPVNFDHASGIMSEQMDALKTSGLLDNAAELVVGVNGDPADTVAAISLAPPSAIVLEWGHRARGELPTLRFLQHSLPKLAGMYVCYHHSKCAMRADEICHTWRRRMQYHVIAGWRRCVTDLERGADAVGCHWLTPESFPGLVGTPYFAGTFWWATAEYLMTLPPLPAPTWENRYHAESWIGQGPHRPKIKDYAPGWPM